MVKVINPDPMFTDEQIDKIEQHYNAKFVCETTLKTKGDGWLNAPVAVFYTETAHPEGSNWFGLYYNTDGYLMVTDAQSALEPFDGLMLEDGSVFYSRFRWDYRKAAGTMVDGGRDYIRYTPTAGTRVVQLKIVKDRLEVVE